MEARAADLEAELRTEKERVDLKLSSLDEILRQTIEEVKVQSERDFEKRINDLNNEVDRSINRLEGEQSHFKRKC